MVGTGLDVVRETVATENFRRNQPSTDGLGLKKKNKKKQRKEQGLTVATSAS